MAAASDAVEIRAFRGSRRTSVYHGHVLAQTAFARILEVAAARGLPLLSSLDSPGPHELDKPAADRLAKEATRLRAGADVPELDDDLTAVAEVAHWCARASGRSWLRIERS
jgi:hypothetical protein